MIKHTNIKHKKKESLKNLFSKLSYSQSDSQSDSHKFQIIQNLNYSNLKTTGTNRKFVIFVPKAKIFTKKL